MITNSNLTPKINFLNKLNLVASTPINGNLNKTYTIQKEVNLKQDLLDSIKEYQKIAISQLKCKLLEKIANACKRPNNEQTDLTSRDMALPEGETSQYSDRQLQSNNDSEERKENKSKEKNPAMEDNGDNAPREDPLKEEDELLEKSILKANKEAMRRLRIQRIQLLRDCMLSSDSEGENKEFNINKMDQEWQEESNRTKLILETIYDNLRMKDATDTFKKYFNNKR